MGVYHTNTVCMWIGIYTFPVVESSLFLYTKCTIEIAIYIEHPELPWTNIHIYMSKSINGLGTVGACIDIFYQGYIHWMCVQRIGHIYNIGNYLSEN